MHGRATLDRCGRSWRAKALEQPVLREEQHSCAGPASRTSPPRRGGLPVYVPRGRQLSLGLETVTDPNPSESASESVERLRNALEKDPALLVQALDASPELRKAVRTHRDPDDPSNELRSDIERADDAMKTLLQHPELLMQMLDIHPELRDAVGGLNAAGEGSNELGSDPARFDEALRGVREQNEALRKLAEGTDTTSKLSKAADVLVPLVGAAPVVGPISAFAVLAAELAHTKRAAEARLVKEEEQRQRLIEAGPDASAEDYLELEASANAEAARTAREIAAVEAAQANLVAVEAMRDTVIAAAKAAQEREEAASERETTIVKMTKTLVQVTWGLAVIAFVALVVGIIGVVIAA